MPGRPGVRRRYYPATPPPVALEPPASPFPPGNPWLPWTDPGPRPPAPDRGGVLAIIPTAGRNPERLRRCLNALSAAAEGVDLHPVVVLCPHTPEAWHAVSAVCRGRAELHPLPGPFNYCRSINAGLAQRHTTDGYALLLNDDCYLNTPGGLATLKATLRERSWAAVGPWMTGREAPDAARRTDGPICINEPLVGTCVLWELAWLDRLDGLDETFGIGWGADESDTHLRALRRGALWGRDDRATASHEFHQTFGDAATFGSEGHRQNVQAFHVKHGADVGLWGDTHHWQPLPGIQVVITGHNVAPWIDRCLDSVERALDGYRWVLILGNDGSTDWTGMRMTRHRTHADRKVYQRFRKATNAGQAKNRVLALGREFARSHPAVLLMDADDEMLPARAEMLWRARDRGDYATLGTLLIQAPGSQNHLFRHGPHRLQQYEGSLSPCTTVLHSSLIPEDGRLFDEEMPSHEDADLWLRWWLQGIRLEPDREWNDTSAPVHLYHKRHGSVMHNDRTAELVAEWQRYRSALLAQHRGG